MPATPDLEFRSLATDADYQACVDLQVATWGEDFLELVPPSLLKISQKMGGVVAGAFAGDGRLLGFVHGLTGVRHGRLAHWSHMLAVAEEARNQGLGTRLKHYQRELLRPLGVAAIYWSYDPLEARNAHLNLNHLGVRVEEYVRDLYGDSPSKLHRGLGTDRLIVAWEIREPPRPGSPEAARGRFAAAPVVNVRPGADGGPEPLSEGALPPSGGAVRVEVPADIQSLKVAAPEAGRRWRAATRRAFEHYLGRGLGVAGFYRDPDTGRCFYGLC